ncbi:MAG: sigma-70 family RNA polymerase sigma factor [Kiritimatiellae bacterium]|nr:sigma-70 family RNA polymerase sigma factor [Kiritimatiellia bacterium]
MDQNLELTVRRVLAGDTEAYAEIVRLYQRDVMRVVAAMLFDRQESEDLVQKVFIRAYEHLDQYQIGRDMAAWLKAIARNIVRSHLREKRSTHRHLQLYREWLDGCLEQEPFGGQDYIERRRRALAECLDRLPEGSRKLLSMRYHRTMSISGISEALGRSVDSITKALSRIRETLRDCIRERLLAT